MTSPFNASTESCSFVGRSAELAALAAHAAQAAAGTPTLVVVEGKTGIGKTALIREAVAALPGFTVWWASCDAHERDLPFGVVDQWLRQVSPRSALASYPKLSSHPGPDSDPVLVGVELIELINAVQQQHPLALVADDIAAADPQSLRVLGFVLRRLWNERVLVLATARTDEVSDTSLSTAELLRRLQSAARNSATIRPTGLSGAEVAALAAARDVPLSAAAAERLRRHTDGLPLYVRSVLTEAPRELLSDPSQPLPLPGSLSIAVRQSLHELPAESELLVDALAVLDAEAPLALVGRLAGLTDASAALGPAIVEGLVAWRPAEPSSPVRVRHRLQRDAVYAAIEPARRRTLHAAAVPLVDWDSSWRHRVAAADRTDPRLADELEQAAERQIAVGDISRAALLLRWAAELSDSRLQYERRLLAAVSRYQYRLNYEMHQASALRAEVELCAPCALRSYVLARYHHFQAEFAEAERGYREALAAALADDDAVLADRIRLALGQLRCWRVDPPSSTELLQCVVESNRLDVRAMQEARHHLALSIMEATGVPGQGLALLPTEEAERVGAADAPLLLARGVLRGLAGELSSGVHDILVQLERTPPVELKLNTAYLVLPFLLYLTGDWERSAALAEQFLAQAVSDDFVLGLTACHAVAAALAAGRGCWEEAEGHRQTAALSASQINPDGDLLFACLADAAIAQARADAPALLAALGPVLDQLARRPAWRISWLPLLAEAQLGAGTVEQARLTCQALERLATRMACLRPVSAWALGLLAEREGDTSLALDAYRKGIALSVTPDDIPLHRARLEEAYGSLLLTRGDDRRSFEALRLAHERYTALGATPFAARAAATLAACGGAPAPRVGLSGQMGGLTEREQLVARLAAQGLTNHEIAKKLFLSVKTVEYHLGHVYQKLGLASRRELREVA